MVGKIARASENPATLPTTGTTLHHHHLQSFEKFKALFLSGYLPITFPVMLLANPKTIIKGLRVNRYVYTSKNLNFVLKSAHLTRPIVVTVYRNTLAEASPLINHIQP